jgi:hypothetical protein
MIIRKLFVEISGHKKLNVSTFLADFSIKSYQNLFFSFRIVSFVRTERLWWAPHRVVKALKRTENFNHDYLFLEANPIYIEWGSLFCQPFRPILLSFCVWLLLVQFLKWKDGIMSKRKLAQLLSISSSATRIIGIPPDRFIGRPEGGGGGRAGWMCRVKNVDVSSTIFF